MNHHAGRLDYKSWLLQDLKHLKALAITHLKQVNARFKSAHIIIKLGRTYIEAIYFLASKAIDDYLVLPLWQFYMQDVSNRVGIKLNVQRSCSLNRRTQLCFTTAH